MKKLFLIVAICFISLQAQAFEDCIITTNGRLTNISIEDNTVIDVHPIITIMNKKDTLVIHPLKEGITCFTVLKNSKEKFLFTVRVEKGKTFVSKNDKFEILSLDSPPKAFEIDLPPLELYEDLEKPPVLKLDEPPFFKKEGKI